jgi:hypothetical protein
MTVDIDKARMKGVVLLDGWAFDKVVSEFYGVPYSSCAGTRDSEVHNGSLVHCDADSGMEIVGENDYYLNTPGMEKYYHTVEEKIKAWLDWKPDPKKPWRDNEDVAPHPAVIVADLVAKGEIADLAYQIYISW